MGGYFTFLWLFTLSGWLNCPGGGCNRLEKMMDEGLRIAI